MSHNRSIGDQKASFSWVQDMERGANFSPSVPYPSLIRKNVLIYCWDDKESFQLTHAYVQTPDHLHQYKAFMYIKISVSDNERNVQSGWGMRTLYTAIYMAFSLLEKIRIRSSCVV